MELSEEDNNALLQSLNNLFPKESNNEEYSEQIIMVEADDQVQEVVVEVSAPRKPKQPRKQKIVLKPINDDEIDLQIIEETPETEIKLRPRREYRTKKRMERLPMKSPSTCRMEVDETPMNGTQKHNNHVNSNSNNSIPITKATSNNTNHQANALNDSNNTNNHNESLASDMDASIKIESTPDQTTPNSDTSTRRRTRLSNTYRVATGKNYVCHNCDFSTDRISNIISHLKGSCPP